MATAHLARVNRVDRFENGAALLSLSLEEPEVLPWKAGQYVIVNAGVTLANGKPAKRAYSLFGGSGDHKSFQLAAERIEGGVVSTYLNALEPGSQLQFSGPWGKFQAPEGGWNPGEKVIGVAFGTGITALLGLFSDPELPAASFIWVRDPAAPFLPDSCIKDLVPPAVKSLHVAARPPEDLSRGAAHAALPGLEAEWQEGARIFAAGEGGAIDQLEIWLKDRDCAIERFHKESFFRFQKAEA